ncbi:MAG: class I SAM-dependent DNA methyltransferase [Candidatus Methanoperedens sp.]|nr:class I SAM-dependent DNA methyltransferase [Candidatus Methanoperedens sp.]
MSKESGSLTQQRLESYLWGAANLLRGYIDAGDYKQFIFPLIFYKRICDVYDEEYQTALEVSGDDIDYASFSENHRFQIPKGAHWKDVRAVTANVGMALQKAMREIETANPDQLYGIFGDAQWTNKDRLSDATLRDLIEHFSSINLTIKNVPQDELGNAYEYLIKKFADDSGHTAAEFYTNRTLVRLMALMLEPKPGESIYDPTCGSGGMPLVAALQVKEGGGEYRTLKLYGQEVNLITSAIARMNFSLHGIEDFKIVRGDTLSNPAFIEKDRLKQFDVVLANPPYSIKQWSREAWASDPYGRNIYGVPPQGRADYAFFQHIIASMNTVTGRCAILFPHGVLFRDEEQKMREKLVEADVIECVLGLGPNLFYNSPMEACVVVCRMKKPAGRIRKIIFIKAVNEVTRERSQSFLEEEHMLKILKAYRDFKDIEGFAKVVNIEEIKSNNSNLSVQLYVRSNGENNNNITLKEVLYEWQESSENLKTSMKDLLDTLKEEGLDE